MHHGYHTQEIDENNGEIVSVEEENDSYEEDAYDGDMDYDDSYED